MLYSCTHMATVGVKGLKYRFADLAAQLVGNALTLVDVDTDAFAKDKFHRGRVTELNNNLHYQINTLVVRRHSVEMN